MYIFSKNLSIPSYFNITPLIYVNYFISLDELTNLLIAFIISINIFLFKIH